MQATAVLIPAHNESRVIGATVAMVRTACPHADVHVVADRCSDDTAARARTAGAQVWERSEDVAGKGAALRWLMHEAADVLRHCDALIVLDADSRPRAGALESLGAAVAAGAGAAQAFVLPDAPSGAAVAVLTGYSEWLSQALEDRIRSRWGWPVPLRGTGMAFRPDLLRRLSERLRTKTEDAELTLLAALENERVVFVPAAIIEDPKPIGQMHAARQRARWLQGQAEIWRFYWRDIVRLFLTRGPAGWSLLSALLAKPRTFVMLAKLLAVLLLRFAGDPAAVALRVLLAVSLALDVLRYAVGLLFVPAQWRRPVLRALVHAPLYVLIWARAAALSVAARATWYRARE